METSERIASLRLDGGHLALDFVNTLGGEPHHPDPPAEWENLQSYEDFLAWCVRLEVLGEGDADRLSGLAGGESALRKIISAREAAWGVLWAVAAGEEPPGELVDALAERERQALGTAHLAPGPEVFEWHWTVGADLLSPLHPLVHSVVALLQEGPLDRLKSCAGCRWLFLDESKNQSRRWCSMETCGAHHKKERYVERRRERRRSSAAGSG